ncbi:MAG: hypothetical protein Q4C47_07010, partial [Planctomycetia bacterium]|nr:hypothetical protein [Planctomycetia bacterium]
MEAYQGLAWTRGVLFRFVRYMAIAAVLTVAGFTSTEVDAAEYATPNFVIQTEDPTLAKAFGDAAELSRREMAELWLGHTLPNWSRPCPVRVTVGDHLGAGGETSFSFSHGEVYGWTMSIQGPADQVIHSVLPHEITHMILASHFRRPLPRWADEGAASSIEHESERSKLNNALIKYLQTNRGISFTRMFAAKEYPPDIRAFYAQAHALTTWMIDRGGHRKYVEFLETALPTGDWTGALKQHYGVESLKSLQETWNQWVAIGMPLSDGTLLAKNAPYAGQTGNVSLASATNSTNTNPTTQVVPARATGRVSASGGVILASHTQGDTPGRVTSGAADQTDPYGGIRTASARPRPEPNLVWTGPAPEMNAAPAPVVQIASEGRGGGWETCDQGHEAVVREFLAGQ